MVEWSDDRADCWLWSGTTVTSPATGNRYGRFRLDRGTKVLAHRFAYAFVVAEVVATDDVHHALCRNTLCCNPWHLAVKGHAEHGELHGPESADRAQDAEP